MEKLIMGKRGEKGKVVSINGDSRFQSRITSIGITVGSVVEVIRNQKKQPIIIYSRDTLIAINNKESEKIMWEVI